MAASTGIAAARCSAIRGSFGKRNRVALINDGPRMAPREFRFIRRVGTVTVERTPPGPRSVDLVPPPLGLPLMARD